MSPTKFLEISSNAHLYNHYIFSFLGVLYDCDIGVTLVNEKSTQRFPTIICTILKNAFRTTRIDIINIRV